MKLGERLEAAGPAVASPAGQLHFRAAELDGIRGWAAVVVLVFHAFLEMLRTAVPQVASPLLAPLFAGDLAVGVFFVLSGDALSAGFFAGGGARVVDRLLVRRYFRLTIPIVLSCALTYLIIVSGVDYHQQANEVLHRPDWLGRFLHFEPTLGGLMRYSLRDVYLAHTTGGSYNPFLWTMSMELLGSIYVCGICYLWPRLAHPQWIGLVIAICLWLLGSLFSLFLAGMVLGYWRKEGFFRAAPRSPTCQILLAVLLVSIAALIVSRAAIGVSIGARSRMALEVTLVMCAYAHTGLRNFLSSRLSRFLGGISFPLYLVHFQVLISLMSWLVVIDAQRYGRSAPAHLLAIAVIGIGASFVVALAFRQLERIALRATDSVILRVLA